MSTKGKRVAWVTGGGSGIGEAGAEALATDGWTVVGPGQYVRSFRLGGGNATVRADHGVMELVSATPNPGFVMTVMPSGADRAVVNFTDVLHVSTLDAWWQDTVPTARVTEIP